MAPTKSSSSTSRPTKNLKPALPVPSSSPEIVAEDISKSSADSPTPTAKFVKKRAAPAHSDSEIEIIETSVNTKKPKGAKPAPNSPNFEKLAPVTVSKKGNKAAAVARKLSFGSTGDNESVSAGETVPPAPLVEAKTKRVSKPSEKVRYMQKESVPTSDRDSDTTPPPAGQVFLGMTRVQKNIVSKTQALPPQVSHDEATVSDFSSDEEKNEAVEANASADVEDNGSLSDDDSSPAPEEQAIVVSKTSAKRRAQTPIELEDNSDDDTPLQVATSKRQIKKLRQEEKQEENTLDSESGDDSQMECDSDNKKVTGKDGKQGRVAKHRPCSLESFISLIKEAQYRGEATDRESSLPVYEAVIEYLKSSAWQKTFKRAHFFKSDGVVVNPARALAADAGVSKDSRVVAAGAGSSGRGTLLFISNGCVAACNLCVPGTNGSGMNQHSVKKIGIWVLNEEFDRMTAYFGAVFGVSHFYSHYFADVLTFQTQKDGGGSTSRNTGASSSTSSPQKSSTLFGNRSPTKSNSTAALSFPPFLKFTEKVPIYDLRKLKDFKFTASNFASLGSLPLYHLGLSDLPQNSAVTVGYTANTYPYKQGDAPANSLALSLNIQFVLLHGKIVAE